MLHTTAEAETFRAEFVRRGGPLEPKTAAARFWVVSDILGFLPDSAQAPRPQVRESTSPLSTITNLCSSVKTFR